MEPLLSSRADDPVFEGLFGVYLKSLSDSLAALDASVTARRYDEVKQHCHKGRGSAATYGFPAVVAALAQLEAAAQTGAEHETLVRLLSEIKTLRERVAAGVAVSGS
jgi:HPt (histidine-containing phosphotransfer) domain-containing protein